MEIIPGILEKDWNEIEKKIDSVKSFSRFVHIDLIDGKFAQNTTFLDPSPFEKYKNSIGLELHMMVEDPEKYIEPFANAGFSRFIGHVEKMPDQVAFVAHAQQWGEVGLALDTDSEIDQIKVSFEDLDFITIMTVKAGFSGQEFLNKMLEKCNVIRTKSSIPIEIDGGVTDSIIQNAKDKGVSRLVATSYLFSDNPKEKYDTLLRLSVEN